MSDCTKIIPVDDLPPEACMGTLVWMNGYIYELREEGWMQHYRRPSQDTQPLDEINHLFQCLAEESAEIIQAGMKCTRFALDGFYPDTGKGNLEVLVTEINDLAGVIEMLQERGVQIVGVGDREQIERKKAKVLKHMMVARERGVLI